MNEMSGVKRAIICAVCIALCYVLPLFFHGIQNAGSIFCPMHIPVFICGLVCGWPYGLMCGLAGPAFSSALTGMPPITSLPVMMVELGLYGFTAGVLMKVVRTGKTYLDLYICMLAAMVVGRVAAGLTSAALYAGGTYSMALWASAYVLKCWPGILIQLIFIPTIVYALMNAGLIPKRYRKELTRTSKEAEQWIS